MGVNSLTYLYQETVASSHNRKKVKNYEQNEKELFLLSSGSVFLFVCLFLFVFVFFFCFLFEFSKLQLDYSRPTY